MKEKIIKLLQSSNIQDILIAIRFMDKLPRYEIIGIILSMNKGSRYATRDQQECTYSVNIGTSSDDSGGKYLKGKRYYYEINGRFLYIDSKAFASNRIKSKETLLGEEL